MNAIASPPSAGPEIITPPARSLALGDYFVELDLAAHCSATPESLKAGMLRLGFSEVRVDTGPRQAAISGTVRFVGRLRTPLSLRDTGVIRWTNARRLAIDLFAPLRGTLEPFDLLPEHLYETRFLSRPVRRKDASRHEKTTDPERAVIVEKLATAGWETLSLSVVERDMRIAARPDNELTMWFGLLRWTGPESFITDDEPFAFEDVTEAE